MSSRLVAACTVLALAALAPVADAGSRCRHLLVDAQGDTDFLGGGELTEDVDGQAIDLLAADLQSDRSSLTAVVHVLSTQPRDRERALDREWSVGFATATASYHLVALRLSDGDAFQLRRVDPAVGAAGAGFATETVTTAEVTGRINETSGVIRMAVPLSAFADTGGLGRTLKDVAAESRAGNGVQPMGDATTVMHVSDRGTTGAVYRVGSRGCV